MLLIFSLFILQLLSLFALYKYLGNPIDKIILYRPDGKGSLQGKTVASLFFSLISILPFFILGDFNKWIFLLTIFYFCVVSFELLIAIKYKIRKSFMLLLVLSCISLLVLPYIITNKIYLLYIIAISICVDTLSNLLGFQFSKLPPNLQFLRLRFPSWISPNKSFSSALISILLVTFIFSFYVEVSLCILAGIGTVIGDAIFSIFKRKNSINDFVATLGPIGGLSDRIDGWIFAILFASISIT